VSIVSAAVAFAAYRRDRPHLSVELERDMVFHYENHEDVIEQYETYDMLAEIAPVPREIALKDPRKVWAFVKIVNDGRRPIKIQKGGVYVPGEPWFTARESEVKLLPEGEHMDVPIAEDALQGHDVLCAFAEDIRGHLYFSPTPWNRAGIVFRVRRIFGRF
jgi:hypothetical protein